MIVSFTPRTSPPFPAALQAIAAGPIVSFRPRTLDRAEHDRQLQPAARPW
jgi:hypothetical protein